MTDRLTVHESEVLLELMDYFTLESERDYDGYEVAAREIVPLLREHVLLEVAARMKAVAEGEHLGFLDPHQNDAVRPSPLPCGCCSECGCFCAPPSAPTEPPA